MKILLIGTSKTILTILSVMLAAIGVVAILSWMATKPSFSKNGFNRKFQQISVNPANVLPKDEGVILMFDTANNNLYFKTKIPGRIFVTDYQLKERKYITFDVPRDERTVSNFACFMDGQRLKILAGNLPGEITGRLDSLAIINKFKTSLFTRVAKIPGDSYIYRGFDPELKSIDQIFFKISTSGKIIKENNISQKYNDGGITTDGMLSYDKKTNALCYVHYYTNQFLIIDTNLNLIHKGYTIDTVRTRQDFAEGVTSSSEKEQKTVTFTNVKPKKIINAASCVAEGKLYNISTLKADNESNEDFLNSTPIDVYDIITGKYEYSFYIPSYKREKVKYFKIINDRMIAIYKSSIINYNFNISRSN